MPRSRSLIWRALAAATMIVAASCSHPDDVSMRPISDVGNPSMPGPVGPQMDPGLRMAVALQRHTDETTWYAVATWNETARWNAIRTAPRPTRGEPGPSGAIVAAESGDVSAAISRWFGDMIGSATGVARCESGLDPGAVSPGGGNWGLFQINTVHRDSFQAVTGRPWSDVLNADANAQFARWLYDSSGWGPWACRWAA